MASIPPSLRRAMWKLSRKLYMMARDEPHNNMASNGERMVALAAMKGAKASALKSPRVLDIGANAGEWTAMALECANQVGLSDVRVDAFEPTPAIATRLKSRHAAAIEKGQVHVAEMAVGAREGSVRFAVVDGLRGTNHIATGEGQGIDVPLTTVDAWFDAQRIERAVLVKVDTEGNDANVVEGAAKSLAAGRIDLLQFEYNICWVDFRRYLKDVYQMAKGSDYSIGKIGPSAVSIYPEWHFELERFIECNFVLIHKRAQAWLPLRRGSFDASNTYA